jgi:signal transduction histidine kinase
VCFGATPDRAPPAVEATAYFVACEALTNAVKHASPTPVVVSTAHERGVLRMTIADDGIGGADALPGLPDRVAAQGGTLAVVSPLGAGTRIEVVATLIGAPRQVRVRRRRQDQARMSVG